VNKKTPESGITPKVPSPKAPAPLPLDIEKRGVKGDSFEMDIIKRIESIEKKVESKKVVELGDMKRPSDIQKAPAPHLPTYD
jgi:hypothetical protein